MGEIKKLMKTRKNIINMITSVFSIAIIILNFVFVIKNKKALLGDTSNFIIYILVNAIILAIICIYYFSNRNEDKEFINMIESLN